MLTNDDRKQILQSFLETIEGISDKKYQIRVWINGKGPEFDDFTETTCHFFEESEGILENPKDFEINTNQYNLMTEMRDQYRKFLKDPKRGYLPQQFIDSPEWNMIVDMAKEILKAFNYRKPENKNL